MSLDLIATAREEATKFFAIDDNLDRIEAALSDNSDPALAVGSTKEVLETVFKVIIHWMPPPSTSPSTGATSTSSRPAPSSRATGATPSLIDLTKEAWTALGGTSGTSVHGRVPNRQVGHLFKPFMTITQTTANLRNTVGTGHGPIAVTDPLDPLIAQLIVQSGLTVAIYFMRLFFRQAEARAAEMDGEVRRVVGDRAIRVRTGKMMNLTPSVSSPSAIQALKNRIAPTRSQQASMSTMQDPNTSPAGITSEDNGDAAAAQP